MTTPELTTITTPAWRTATAMVAVPKTFPAPGMLLFHAFRGLTQEFIDFAETYANKGYFAVAPDLYKGEVTDDFDEAYALMDAMDEEECTDMAVAWVDWVRKQTGCSGKVGTVGWCLGGTWSLNTSVATPVDATVVYYGSVAKTEEQLNALKGPVLGHFGTQDEHFGKDMVDAFEKEMEKAGKKCANFWYEADHAFANTGAPAFDADAAKQADDRTFSFFEKFLSD